MLAISRSQELIVTAIRAEVEPAHITVHVELEAHCRRAVEGARNGDGRSSGSKSKLAAFRRLMCLFPLLLARRQLPSGCLPSTPAFCRRRKAALRWDDGIDLSINPRTTHAGPRLGW